MQERTDWAPAKNVPSQVCVFIIVHVDLMRVQADHEEHHPDDRGDEKRDDQEQDLMRIRVEIGLARTLVRGDRRVSEQRSSLLVEGWTRCPLGVSRTSLALAPGCRHWTSHELPT